MQGKSEDKIGNITAKMASYLMAGKLVSFILMAIAFMLVTRILGPATYGLYTLTIATIGFFLAFGSFGIDTASTKFVSEYKYRHTESRIGMLAGDVLSLILLVGFLLACISIFASQWLAATFMHSSAYAYLIEIASISILGTMLFNTFFGITVGYGNGRHAASAIIAMSTVQASVNIVLAIAGFGAAAPLLGLISGQLVGFAFMLVILSRRVKIALPSFQRIKKLFWFSIPIGASNMLNNIYSNVIIMLLGAATSSFVLGNIGVASVINYLVGLITGSAGTAILPMFANKFAGDPKKLGSAYSTSTYLSIVLIAPMLMLIMFFSTQLSYAAFGSAYSLAPSYVLLLAFGSLIGIASMYFGQLLVTTGRTKKLFEYTAINFSVEIALAIFIWKLGGIWAAFLLYVIPAIVWNLIFFGIEANSYSIRLPRKLGRVALANIAMIIFVLPALLIPNMLAQMLAGIAIAIVAYPALLGLFGGVSINDISIVESLSEGMPILGWLAHILSNYVQHFVS
ncbi:MAG: oligosaccharide flippase family protein [Candidatus Micrarchaeaceae archaeon]